MDLTRLIVPGMQMRGRGHVVNIASLAGKLPSPQLASYSASKHGVVGFTAALRAELGDGSVGFSAICPGFVSRAGMYGRIEPYLEGASDNPMGTVPPEEIGRSVVRAIREDRGEIVVNRRPVKPLILLHGVAPALVARLGRLRRVRDFSERMARARDRYEETRTRRR
jgi:short-subunit dehydrogenase